MRKLFIIIFSLMTICSSAQHFRRIYTNLDTLKVESVSVGVEDYLVNLSTQLIIAYNSDKTKAIVFGYMFGKHFEYNVKDDSSRLILWYKNRHIYCGYIYDKKSKTAKYFEAINREEKDKLVTKIPFIKHIPSFYDNSSSSNSR